MLFIHFASTEKAHSYEVFMRSVLFLNTKVQACQVYSIMMIDERALKQNELSVVHKEMFRGFFLFGGGGLFY